jgi:hypothetical protein
MPSELLTEMASPEIEKTSTGKKHGGKAGRFGPHLVATVTLLTRIGWISQSIFATIPAS